jgi:hypothetical protein
VKDIYVQEVFTYAQQFFYLLDCLKKTRFGAEKINMDMEKDLAR